MSDQAISDAYADLLARGPSLGASEGFTSLSEGYAGGLWRYEDGLLSLIPSGIAGKTVLDYGAKFGHIAPLLFARGAAAVVCVDVEDEYLEIGARVFSAIYPKLHHLKSDRGLLPLQPSSVDVVITNEVISHINPMYLDTYYAEVGRILREDSHIVISDGNNYANASVRAALPDVWDAWENGPEGRRTDRDVVAVPYIERRRRLVRARHPSLSGDEIEKLARNTSGAFGEHLDRAVDAYVTTGILIERPYRYGTCPTNPGPGGVVMERAFHPEDVVRGLAQHGIEARQVFHPQYEASMARVRAASSAPRPWWKCKGASAPPVNLAGAFSMFQVLGTKEIAAK